MFVFDKTEADSPYFFCSMMDSPHFLMLLVGLLQVQPQTLKVVVLKRDRQERKNPHCLFDKVAFKWTKNLAYRGWTDES